MPRLWKRGVILVVPPVLSIMLDHGLVGHDVVGGDDEVDTVCGWYGRFPGDHVGSPLQVALRGTGLWGGGASRRWKRGVILMEAGLACVLSYGPTFSVCGFLSSFLNDSRSCGSATFL